jgi:hypothetical protein
MILKLIEERYRYELRRPDRTQSPGVSLADRAQVLGGSSTTGHAGGRGSRNGCCWSGRRAHGQEGWVRLFVIQIDRDRWYGRRVFGHRSPLLFLLQLLLNSTLNGILVKMVEVDRRHTRRRTHPLPWLRLGDFFDLFESDVVIEELLRPFGVLLYDGQEGFRFRLRPIAFLPGGVLLWGSVQPSDTFTKAFSKSFTLKFVIMRLLVSTGACNICDTAFDFGARIFVRLEYIGI